MVRNEGEDEASTKVVAGALEPAPPAAAQETVDQGKTAFKASSNVPPAEFQREFFLQEYNSLHDEIDTRLAQRGNLFTFTIITAGSLLSLGASANAQIALFYPVLSLFLAAAWSNEDRKIGSLSAYLHERELAYGIAGWETYHRVTRKKQGFFLVNWQPFNMLSFATRGVFLSTQILAILVGFTQVVTKSLLAGTWPLLTLAVLSTVITAFVIQHRRNRLLPEE
jgi:hypothetical protein